MPLASAHQEVAGAFAAYLSTFGHAGMGQVAPPCCCLMLATASARRGLVLALFFVVVSLAAAIVVSTSDDEALARVRSFDGIR